MLLIITTKKKGNFNFLTRIDLRRHLNPTVLETLQRPTLLITDTLNALNTQLVGRRARDPSLYGTLKIFLLPPIELDSMISTLNKGGNVLCPVDTATRVL